MPKLSIVFITYRCGGIDVMADSLANQTYKDFELIIVDDYVPNRIKEINSYLNSNGLQAKYIGPSKPKSFPEVPFNVSNAINTGIILSTGEVVCLYQDYQWLPPDFLEKMVNRLNQIGDGYCIVTPAFFWDKQDARKDSGLITVWDKHWAGHPTDNNCIKPSKWIPGAWEFAFIAHPWQSLVNMNGYPEYLDCDAAHRHEAIMEWVANTKYKPYVDKENFMHSINHREWQPAEMWHQAKKKGQGVFNKRDNPFNLASITRGVPFWLKKNENKYEGEKAVETIDGVKLFRWKRPDNIPHLTVPDINTGKVGGIVYPFVDGALILDVGGGANPQFRPNMDMNKSSNVDIVGDVSEKWPLPSALFDGIHARFVIEHLKWSKLSHFASECYRVLRPGGIAFVVTNNMFEVAREILERKSFAEPEAGMVYGQQDGTIWDCHRSGLSPDSAKALFIGAGFSKVEVKPWPGFRAEMIIQAYKPQGLPAGMED